MAIYQGAPLDPPPVPLILSSTYSENTTDTLRQDIETLTSYLNSLIDYLASYRPTIEVP